MRKMFGVVLLFLLGISSALADKQADFQLRIGAGALHILEHDQTGLGKIDYLIRPLTRYQLIPVFGYWATGTKDQYLYAGFEKHFSVADDISLFIGLAVGSYIDQDGVDLGHDLEFQSRIGLSYYLDDDQALDLELGHLSNARISDLNPGTEFASFSYRHLW